MLQSAVRALLLQAGRSGANAAPEALLQAALVSAAQHPTTNPWVAARLAWGRQQHTAAGSAGGAAAFGAPRTHGLREHLSQQRHAGCTGGLACCGCNVASAASGAAGLHTSSGARHGHSSDEDENAETISVTYDCERDGKSYTVKAPLGKSLLEVAHANDIELEGACEGSLACSTCHVIIEDQAYYDKLPEPTEDELDMLDLAFGLTDTSRLGCQVIASKDLDGLRVKLPSATRNFYVDGHVPKPH